MRGISRCLMKFVGYILIIIGMLLFCFETMMVIGESHLALKNLHVIIPVYTVAIIIFAVGWYLIRGGRSD